MGGSISDLDFGLGFSITRDYGDPLRTHFYPRNRFCELKGRKQLKHKS